MFIFSCVWTHKFRNVTNTCWCCHTLHALTCYIFFFKFFLWFLMILFKFFKVLMINLTLCFINPKINDRFMDWYFQRTHKCHVTHTIYELISHTHKLHFHWAHTRDYFTHTWDITSAEQREMSSLNESIHWLHFHQPDPTPLTLP